MGCCGSKGKLTRADAERIKAKAGGQPIFLVDPLVTEVKAGAFNEHPQREAGLAREKYPPECQTLTSVDLPAATSMRLSDSERYLLLCGAIGATYGADAIASLEPRVTPRSVVLSRLAAGEATS